MSFELRDAIRRYIAARGGRDGFFATPIDGLVLMQASRAETPSQTIYEPALCVVVQGAKQATFGDRTLEFGAMQSLIISVELPVFGRVTRASAAEPFLALSIAFDTAVLRDVMAALDPPPAPNPVTEFGVTVGSIEGPLADCLLRLVRLLETPKAIPILAPAAMREIAYWLLTGPAAGEVCKLALPGSHTSRVAEAITLLRGNYTRALRVAELAAAARMSCSSFHQHFKALTSMTPLQYQKHLRLVEARRLMLASGASATTAAYRVGYESASQFSREYARLFGQPPKRDAAMGKKTGGRISPPA